MEDRLNGPRFIVTGGGTGGHIYPALAVAGALKSRYPDAQILYVGGKKGLEKELVPREGFDFVALEIRGLERSLSPSAIVSLWKAAKSLFQALGIIRRFKPDAVIGTGGYASFPVGAAAELLHIPLILHEQNVYPGLANRILGSNASGIAISWGESGRGFSGNGEVLHTGNPIRSAIVGTTREEALGRLGLKPAARTLLIFGGSQGAVRITGAAIDAMKLCSGGGIRYILATGSSNFENACAIAKASNIDFARSFAEKETQFYILPYIHDMGAALAVCDVVACRSGAMTLAEITAKGIPSILVPHPYVPDDVQRKNAWAMRDAGAAIVIEDKELDGESLKNVAERLFNDSGKLAEMSEAALRLSMPGAAEAVADLVVRHMKGAHGHV